MIFESRNPSSGKQDRIYDQHSDSEIDEIVSGAESAFLRWRVESTSNRAKLALSAGAVLRKRSEDLARLITTEMGKPIIQALSEVEKCASLCDYYALNAARFLADEPIETDAQDSFVSYQPLGIVLGIMPWNFPLWQVFRYAIPTITAGNATILKHAPNVPQCAEAIASIFYESGYPPNTFQNLFADNDQIKQLISDPRISAITLTGSTEAGRSVASTSGKAIKKTVLELGGSDACVILGDADLDLAASQCVESRLLNCGQSCIAGKRFIVASEIAAAFTHKVIELMKARRCGDPLDATTEIGPMARIDLRDNLHLQVMTSVAGGANLVLGGFIPDGPGFYYPPTILAGVESGTPAYDEELFGPVAAVIEAKDTRDAIRIANDTSFGLGASIYTSDIEKGRRIARDQLNAGACFVNAFVRSDPRLPFGGIKESGYGRELSSHGIREFTNAKTVVVQ